MNAERGDTTADATAAGLAAAAAACWEWLDGAKADPPDRDAPDHLDLSCLEGLWSTD